MHRSIELKIKIKSLAVEAAIIRHEERKLSGMEKWKLQDHRKTTVRDAARRTLIAYQHIRGKDASLHMCQPRRWDDRVHVEKMVKRYGDTDSIERLGELWSTPDEALVVAA